MEDYPNDLLEFEEWFGTEDACGKATSFL